MAIIGEEHKSFRLKTHSIYVCVWVCSGEDIDGYWCLLACIMISASHGNIVKDREQKKKINVKKKTFLIK